MKPFTDPIVTQPAPGEDESARWIAILPWVQDMAEKARGEGRAPMRILDVGCGRGWQAHLLSAYGEVEAVDRDAAAVEHARRLFPTLRVRHAEAQDLARSFRSERFDLVVASDVLEHVPAAVRPAFVAALARLLDTGGRLLLTTPREPLRDGAPEALKAELAEEHVEGLLEGAGLRAAARADVWFDDSARAFAAPPGGGPGAVPRPVHRVWCFEPTRDDIPSSPAAREETPTGAAAPIGEPRTFDPERPDYALTPVSPLRPRRDYRPADLAATPVVAIVTPFFDTGAVFHETAESVFRQSLQQWEWIIVDDGSTDPVALRILDEYARKDPRIRVIHQANQGPGAARNRGSREARAELLYYLDSDDLLEPTALEKMAWHLATHPEWSFTAGFSVAFGSREYLWRNGFHDGRGFLEENLATGRALVRKSAHQALGGYDEANRKGMEDWDFWLKAAARGRWGSTVPEFLDWYRRRDTGRGHWENIVQKEKGRAFRANLQRLYPTLWKDGFPRIEVNRPQLFSSVEAPVPFTNRLTSSRSRLLFLVPHFEMGGADKFNLDLIQQLQDRHGYEVTVVATRRSAHPWRCEFERLTPDVFVLHNFLHVSDFPLFLRYLVESRRPDVVCLSHSLLGYQLLPYLRAHFPDLPFVDYLHIEEEAWIGGGYPRLSVRHQSQLTRSVVSSRHLKEWMVERGADAGLIDVAYTDIDADRWRRERFDAAALARKWGVEPARPVILYAGRVCEQKQPRVLAEVIRRVAGEHPDFTLLVAGDGPDLPWLRSFVERERLSQVRFLGAVPNDAVAELLAISDVLFLPSLWEGISLAVYEAMAMGAVTVSAVVGGQAELVTPDSGVLVRRGPMEIDDYVDALVTLLREPDRRREMARRARQRIVDEFPIAELGRRMDTVFRAAREAARARRGHLMSPELAGLHAAAVVEEARVSDLADALHRDLVQTKLSLGWRTCLQAGRALLAEGSNRAALQAMDEAVRAAAATGLPQVEVSARLAVADALLRIDRERSVAVLRGALDPAERAEGRGGRENLEKILRSIEASGAATQAAGEGTPRVSVVIPCYEQARFLAEAVESVLAQSFRDWEILIVDDGSPDDTAEVARALIAKHSDRRIRLVEKPNGGPSSARNAGIRAARGAYVLPLDADDMIRPTLLEKLVPVLDARPGVGFAYAHIQHFGALDTEYPLPDFDRVTLIAKDNIACVCSLLRKSMWEEVGGYDEAMREGYEDWDFWISCVERGWDGYCVHEPLFLYRKTGQGRLQDANRQREVSMATIVRNHPKLYDERSQRWASGVLERRALAAPNNPIGRHTAGGRNLLS